MPVNEDTAAREQREPAIAVEPFGHALAVWTDKPAPNEDIFFSRLPAQFYLWGPDWPVSDEVNGWLGLHHTSEDSPWARFSPRASTEAGNRMARATVAIFGLNPCC